MNKINIIGLGPGSVDHLTMGAVNKINSGVKNFLRTENHPTIEYFKENNIDYDSFDYIYEEADNFEQVYETIVEEIIEKSKEEEINYLVPGNPLVAENTVKMLIEKDLDIEIVSGLSFIEPILELVGKDPVDGFQLIDGLAIKETDLNINQDTVVTQIYNNRIMSDVKLILAQIYGDEYKVYFIQNAGIKDEEFKSLVPIYKLDREFQPDLLTSLYIPKKNKEENIYDFNDLLEIMEVLRSEDGCSWDKKQTHESLREALIEEAYELIYAIDEDDVDNMIEELGDVLLQVIFHSQIAYDEGRFSIYEVLSTLGEKLIYRHPHIFSHKNLAKSDDMVYNWDVLKYEKRNINTYTGRLKDIKGLPSLLRSYKIQNEAAKIGFDWEDIQGPIDKINEEYEEVLKAIDNNEGFDSLEEEIGDIFFSVVNLSRFLGVNPEIALNRTSTKFINRIEYMEKLSIKKNVDLKDLSLEELDELWNEAKIALRK